ncbi:hypothetical protein JCM11491_004562 [Sporobolomyces phaffii]
MHPRPRPPQRAPSSRFTTLPTPLSPRRSRPSALSNATSPAVDHASSASASFPSPVWSSSVPPDTPPLGTDRDTEPIDPPRAAQRGDCDGDNTPIQVAREDDNGGGSTTPTSTLPFLHATTDTSRDGLDGQNSQAEAVSRSSTHSRSHFNFVLDDDSTTTTTPDEGAHGLVLDPNVLGQMSREELEKMLSQADRIIREKEQELSVFTSAGEGLLQEYHNLRNRHENLLSRQRSTSGASASPLRPSRLSSVGLSPSHARLPSDSGSQRGWRNSLGPSTSGAGAGRHRRVSSGRVGIASSTSYVFAPSGSTNSLVNSSSTVTTTPPHTIKVETIGGPSPSTSPTALRSHRFTSSTSVASLFAPPPRTATAMSPTGAAGVDAHEVEHLSYQNYSLTQRVEELEAESEFAEREGRKKLRRLERELLAMKQDLERSEGRNAELEQERQRGDEKKGARRERERSRGDSSAEEREAGDGDDDAAANATFTSPRTPLVGTDQDKGGATDHADRAPTSPSPSRFLTAPANLSSFRAPGNGVSRLRAVSSTSSLASLPRIPLFDPSLLDAQQDELLNQLIAKIDELQDANEAILEEREDMEEKLEIAREEVREWMGKCEDLEEQHKLEWEGNDQRAIAWLDDSSATTERRSRFDSARQPDSRDGSPTPPSTARPDLGRSLRNELSGLWSQDSSTSRQDPDTIEVTDDEEESQVGVEDSIVVHSSSNVSGASMANLNVPRIRRRNPRRTITPISFSQRSTSTADDLVISGTLGTTGKLDSRGYDDFATRAEKLEPVWADETDPLAGRLEGPAQDKQRLLEAPESATQRDERDPRVLQSKKRGQKVRKKSKHLVLSSIRFGSDDEDDMSTPVARRTLALRRLGLEASSRHTSRMFTQPRQDESAATQAPDDDEDVNDDCDDAASIVSSNYDLVDPRDNLASNDYYPVTLRARYHPRMLTSMMRDSAVRHVVTLITWLRFLVVLAMALSFAVWQGPRKTLGLVDGRRRLG